jgi:transposase
LAEAVVIGALRGVSAYAYGEPCDMRKSFNTLSAIVAEKLRRDLASGDLFLFVSKDRKRAKILYFDGTGLCLLAN